MIVEITLHDAVLQHAAERDSEASRRPGELPRQGKVRGEQHCCSGCNGAPGREKRGKGLHVRQQQPRNGKNQSGEQHGESRTMRRRGKGNEQEQPKALCAPKVRAMKDNKMQRKDGHPGKNVGQQHAAQHRQCRE